MRKTCLAVTAVTLLAAALHAAEPAADAALSAAATITASETINLHVLIWSPPFVWNRSFHCFAARRQRRKTLNETPRGFKCGLPTQGTVTYGGGTFSRDSKI